MNSVAQSPRVLALVLLVGANGVLRIGQPIRTQAYPAAATTHAAIPDRLGVWVGKPLAVTDRVVQILETDDVALMEYRREGESPVWLAHVAGFGNRAAFHPPELCYVGSRFEVLERGPVTLNINGQVRQVMRLIIGQEGKRYEAWYWFTANGRTTPNYYQQQWWLMLEKMHRHPTFGTLVRISTPLDEVKQSARRLTAFMEAWDRVDTTGVAHGS